MTFPNMGMPVGNVPLVLQIVFLLGLVGWLVILAMPGKRKGIFRKR